uniref:Uncharacterized protein n=1 Tax=Timema monikensis TaxID=170555 RepID=A0A7R9EDB3_9NEOP|nr:unnamed protein product [Timema monikensis]
MMKVTVMMICLLQLCPGDRSASDAAPSTPAPDIALTVGEDNRPKSRLFVSPPVPVRSRPQTPLWNQTESARGWEDATLTVPDTDTPVPPPRTKKLMRQGQQKGMDTFSSSMDALTSELMLRSGNSAKNKRPNNFSTVSLPNFSGLGSLEEDDLVTVKKISSTNSLPQTEKCLPYLKGQAESKNVQTSKSLGAINQKDVEITSEIIDDSCGSEDSWSWDFNPNEDEPTNKGSLSNKSGSKQSRRPSKSPSEDKISHAENNLDITLNRISDSNMSQNNSEHNILPPSEFRTGELPVKDETIKIISSSEKTQKTNPKLKFEIGNKTEIKTVKSKSPPTPEKYNDWFDNRTLPAQNTFKSTQNGHIDEKNNQNSTKTKVYDFSRFITNPASTNEKKLVTRTPPPSPEIKDDLSEMSFDKKRKDTATSGNDDDDDDKVVHSSLLRILNDYNSDDTGLGDTDAQDMLLELGVPLSLRDQLLPEVHRRRVIHSEDPKEEGVLKSSSPGNESSGRSSMTPSLSELEAALSDLLAAAGTEEEEEDVSSGLPKASSTPKKAEDGADTLNGTIRKEILT